MACGNNGCAPDEVQNLETSSTRRNLEFGTLMLQEIQGGISAGGTLYAN